MSKVSKTPGQAVIERLVAFLSRYVVFPNEPTAYQALVESVWAVWTHVSHRMPMGAFLHISASTSSGGKSTNIEVLEPVCRVAKIFKTARPLSVCQWISARRGQCTYILDECEKLSVPTLGDTRSMYAAMQRRSGVHSVNGHDYSMYCALMLAGIGDLQPILRERAIVIYLAPGKPVADYWGEIEAMQTEAAAIVRDIRAALGLRTMLVEVDGVTSLEVDDSECVPLPLVDPSWLSGRDREIWTPLFTVAKALGLDRETLDHLAMASVDISRAKKEPPRPCFSVTAERAKASTGIAEALIRDIASVLTADDKTIKSDVLVARLKALPLGQWRGISATSALTPQMMGDHLSRFGLKTKNQWMPRRAGEPKTAKGSVVKVWECERLRDAARRLGANPSGLAGLSAQGGGDGKA